MINTVYIKAYEKKYEDEVINLILNIQQNEYNVPITKSDQPDLLDVEAIYQTGKGNFWIAFYDNKVVGTISFLDIGNDEVALRKLFVEKAYRGSTFKVAHHLLDAALKWAHDKQIEAIYLGTTTLFLAAHRFYEKSGFTRIAVDQLPENFPVLQVDKVFYKYQMTT